jgi:glutamine---fructose-6-phosphate transaminase (isomerizing)
VQILACGTSYYAGLTARYWIEAIAGLPCSVEIASEYRYRDAVANRQQLIVTISQSGETLDTMEALNTPSRWATTARCRSATCPRARSRAPVRLVFYTRAGAEIGVASTKAFTTQLVALFALTARWPSCAGAGRRQEADYLDALRHLPGSVQHALNLEPQIRVGRALRAEGARAVPRPRRALPDRAGRRAQAQGNLLHPRRGLSGRRAQARPAGAGRRGDAGGGDRPNDALLEKVKSNMQEVRARGGELFVFADEDSHFSESEGVHVIRTPRHVGVLSPIVHAIPVQLLAYHTALARGTDVDKPRNLAKARHVRLPTPESAP